MKSQRFAAAQNAKTVVLPRLGGEPKEREERECAGDARPAAQLDRRLRMRVRAPDYRRRLTDVQEIRMGVGPGAPETYGAMGALR